MKKTHQQVKSTIAFSKNQWKFLALFEAFAQPVEIDLAAALVPLSPSELFDFLDKCRHHNLLNEPIKSVFILAESIPEQVLAKLKGLNTSSTIAKLITKLNKANLWNTLSEKIQAGLLDRAGQESAAAVLESEIAHVALHQGDDDAAYYYLMKTLEHLSPHTGCPDNDTLYVESALKMSNISWKMGKGLEKSQIFLKNALECTERLGNKRSRVLINMHLSLLYYYADRRKEAFDLAVEGEREINELEDEDIRLEFADFIGFFYIMRGKIREAMIHIELAFQRFESSLQDGPISSVAPLTIGSSVAPLIIGFVCTYTGQFNRSIGYLDYTWRWARQNSHFPFAAAMQASLGVVLLQIGHKQTSLMHLKEALKEAAVHGNYWAEYIAESGMAYYHFLEGQINKAREWIIRMQSKKSKGLVRQISSPWILELLYEFDKQGSDPISEFNFEEEYERSLRESSIHLRGTALQLKAKQDIENNESETQILECLLTSQKYLEESGDPIQLAKTQIELAYFYLNRGERDKACNRAQLSRKGLSGNLEHFFPDGLRTLLDEQKINLDLEDQNFQDIDLNDSLDMSHAFSFADDVNRSLNYLISQTNQFFSAERGGLFWIEDNKSDKLVLLSARNISSGEIYAKGFEAQMALIKQTIKQEKPTVISRQSLTKDDGKTLKSAVLCLPLWKNGHIRGVLYHDNSYLNDCFDKFNQSQLLHLSKQLSESVAGIFEHCRLLEESKRLSYSQSVAKEESADQIIVAKSQQMTRILSQAKQVAETESTILILGETGVGKGLLAKRIHEMSLRHQRPFITIDPTTIPENLIESELFGYEKGAFTGANNKKTGWIELAHKGSLFIDEIGEIPKSLQVKLLRVIQEKSYSRVGGTRSLISDFRLVAATNRNLETEVAEGRFRKDLYYRLSTVEITLPPLSERKEDIPGIAEHFLKKLCKKFNRPGLELSAADIEMLETYAWPGNIRELQNIIERAVILSIDNRLELNLPMNKSSAYSGTSNEILKLDEVQRRHIRFVLNKTGGRIAGSEGAAELLGMKRTSLYARMRSLGLDPKNRS